MKPKKLTQIMTALTIGLVFLLSCLASCEKFNSTVEDQLREDEFEMEIVDQLAADILSDSSAIDTMIVRACAGLDTIHIDSTYITGNDTDIVRYFFYKLEYASGKKDTIPINLNNYSVLLDTLDSKNFKIAVKDTAYELQTIPTLMNSVLSLTTGTEGELVFYFTDYVLMEIVKENGTVITAKSDNIPLELSAGCFTIVSEVPQPIVKARYGYELDPSTRYLLKIIKNDQTEEDDFRGLIINE